MRTREEIKKDLSESIDKSETNNRIIAQTLYIHTEILLDIRDLLANTPRS